MNHVHWSGETENEKAGGRRVRDNGAAGEWEDSVGNGYDQVHCIHV